MKTKLLIVGAGIFALAGGLMFCGENEFFDDFPDEEVRDDVDGNGDVAENTPFDVTIDLAYAGQELPAYWAVRIDGTWQPPKPDGRRLELTLPSSDAEYGVVVVCDTLGDDGRDSITTTLLEATARELPHAVLGCPSADAASPMQVSGAIRNVNGQPATLSIGDESIVVENTKGASDVLFGTTAAGGTRTIVASVGEGEKQQFAMARGVQVAAGTTVELDMADGQPLQPHVMKLATDGATRAAGGRVNLWVDGKTRIDSGALRTWTDGEPQLSARSTNDEQDFLDVRAAFRGPALPTVEFPPLARARFLNRANSEQVVMPELTWIGPSHAYVSSGKIEFSWSRRNWAVFGQDGDDLSVFMPVAYVGTVRTWLPAASHELRVVVTPLRERAAPPHFQVPDLTQLPGWLGRWSFPTGPHQVQASSGNLTAHAGDGAADPGAAIAAYLDTGHEVGPSDLGVEDSLTVVVAGSPVSMVKPGGSLTDMLEAHCFEQRPCSAKIKGDLMAVEQCPDIAAFNDCREDPADRWSTSKEEFVRDLKHEILTWYQSGAEIPGAVSQDEALAGIRAENVKKVTDRTADEWWLYNPDVYQIYYHPDPTRPNSPTIWYGAYLAGQLVSIHPVNWDVEWPDGDIDTCRIRFQSPTETVVGVPTDPLYAVVFIQGATEGNGQGDGVQAEIGWGSDAQAYKSFDFQPMNYHSDVDGFGSGAATDDQYVGALTLNEIGQHYYLARVRKADATGWTYCDLDGSDNGVAPEQLGVINVTDTGNTIDACQLWFPQLVDDAPEGLAVTYRARVKENGATGSQTAHTTLVGELLVGPPDADPTQSLESFARIPTRPSGYPIGLAEGEDEYLATFGAPGYDQFAYAFRFSADGGTTWSYCGLQDSREPSGEFSPQRMGALTAVPDNANQVESCLVEQEQLVDAGTLPELTVRVFDPELTVNTDGSDAETLQVEAAAIPLEQNPAWTSAPWSPLSFEEAGGEVYRYNGNPYSVDARPDAGTYNVVARVRYVDGGPWRYCDASTDNWFLLGAASRLTVAP